MSTITLSYRIMGELLRIGEFVERVSPFNKPEVLSSVQEVKKIYEHRIKEKQHCTACQKATVNRLRSKYINILGKEFGLAVSKYGDELDAAMLKLFVNENYEQVTGSKPPEEPVDKITMFIPVIDNRGRVVKMEKKEI